MAKIDWKAIYTKLGKRCETYALKVRSIMDKRIGEIVAMCEGLELQDGKPFAFADYPEISKQVQATFRLMYSEIYQSIRGNITQEWYYSNADMDSLLAGLFGKGALEDKHFARYFGRNKEAMNQFFARKEAGMNLSQRVWAITGNTKADMEVAIDLSLGQGVDAGELSRKVRQYLQEPDMLFRRFRYRVQEPVLDNKGKPVLDKNGKPVMQGKVDKDGKPVYGRKWKRRHYDKATDSFYWEDDNPHNYHTGRGVYRSSYKNAMRLARTETNMAYRAADCERWKEMEFVRGFRVVLSKNHPCDDICNDLSAADENDTSGRGEYPKGFVFKGWHTHCYCYCIPLLCTEDELFKLTEQILRGEDTSGFVPAGVIEQPNEHFMQWVENNKDKISDQIADPQRGWGSLPYFLQDNYSKASGKGNWVQEIKNEAGLDTWGKVLAKNEIDITKYSNVQSVVADDFVQASNYVNAADYPLFAGGKLGDTPLGSFAMLEDDATLQSLLAQAKLGNNALLNYTSEAELELLEKIATQSKFTSKADGTFVTAMGKQELQAILSSDTALFNGGRYVGTNYSQTLASALKNGVVAESEGAVAVLKLPKGSRYAQMILGEQPSALLLPNSRFKVVSTEVKTIVQGGKATKVTHYTLELVEDGSAKVQEVAQAMKLAKADVRAYNKAVKVGDNVVAAFNKGKYELLGLDTGALDAALATGDAATIQAETKALAKQMAAAKKAALAQAADEPVEWVLAQTYGEAEAKAFMANWAKHMANGAGMDDATFLKKIIEKELFYANKAPNKYATTGEFIKYMDKLKVVYENRIAFAAIQPDIDAAIVFAQTTKSAKVKNLVMELQALTGGSNPDLPAIKAKLAEAQKEIDRLEKERLKRLLKKGGGSYDIEQFYDPADKAEMDRLRAQLEDRIKKAKGDIRDYWVEDAQNQLANFTVRMGEKYASMQPKLADLSGLTDTQVRACMSDYLAAKPTNPRIWVIKDLKLLDAKQKAHLQKLQDNIQSEYDNLLKAKTAKETKAAKTALQDARNELASYCNSLPYGAVKEDYAFGNVVGGEYSYLRGRCEALSTKLAGYGLNVTWQELSLITRYCHGSNFVNHYCFGIGSVHNCLDPVIKSELKALLDKYIPAVNSSMARMPRYNGVTYRGVDIWPAAIKDPSQDGFWDSIIKAWNSPSKTWTTPNPTSSTYSIGVADGFANNIMGTTKGQRVIMKIHGKTGVNVQPISPYGSEAEIMFRAGSKFRMLKAPYKCTTAGIGRVGDWVVELEEII
ncbi:MAG: hypothetical protein NC548_37430 [Lachnospiraceae bacterium]|nr:hypothetical protein [Lachnospiraceae bacterium]